MGMDLTLEARYKGSELETTELCYGRKTWSIWNFFADNALSETSYTDYVMPITLELWEDFMNVVRPKVKLLEKLQSYQEDEETFTKTQRKKYREAISWFEDNFNATVYCGHMWDLMTILSWYKSSEEVLSYLNNKDYKVALINSY